MFTPADRIKKLPPYLFAEINKMKARLAAEGVDVIDVGIGDPDMPTPSHIIDALCKAAHDPRYHCYPPYAGTKEFLEASTV
jgi:LL-diaminopimelate aminotransferase